MNKKGRYCSRPFFIRSAFCVVDLMLKAKAFAVDFFDFRNEFWDFETRHDREAYFSFLYGMPRAFGARDRPIKPASTMIVSTYGIIWTN
jgi:hypothetical protein